DIYNDIAVRSGGDVYIGVVGPVRTGKSTLIKRFMTELVLPNAEEGRLQEMVDELPQSAAGRTVMTTEPKFIPAKAVKVTIDNAEANVRLIDCVGFAVEGASGFEEDGNPRLVNTMWSDTPLPFTEAAAIGTQKVIRDHSTIGLCVTCDGSVTGIDRAGYIPAEERTVAELKKIGKPFVVVLNCADPQSRGAQALKEELQEKYSCPVVAVNCETASVDELSDILRAVLFEFPVTGVDVKIPEWIRVMPADSTAISELLTTVRTTCEKIGVMRECSLFDEAFADSKIWKGDVSVSLSLATGKATVEVGLQDGVLFDMLSEISGESICDEAALMQYVAAASVAKQNYDKVKDAFECAKMTGYGIVCPDDGDLTLDTPKVVKQGGNMGIKLRASAPSYHVVKVDVSGEVSPIMGHASQSEDMVNGIMSGFDTDPEKTWNTALFGKSLRSMVKEGLDGKVTAMQEDTRAKMRRTITRIVNEGRGGVICI
ncbi:MAG: stage IV sporulation protein A, partial [Clostridia bacterium]|nr:stage IV sporulation protein A [Clostridia bacterium]